jgi:hypothetical protein
MEQQMNRLPIEVSRPAPKRKPPSAAAGFVYKDLIAHAIAQTAEQRLAAVRAEILRLRAAPYACGRNGPHRLVRDEYILQGIAAHLHACMIEASSA